MALCVKKLLLSFFNVFMLRTLTPDPARESEDPLLIV